MGGMFLTMKREAASADKVKMLYRPALDSLSMRGIKPDRVIDNERFCLFTYRKAGFSHESYIDINGQDFVLCVGTLIYRGKVGASALNHLYEDFCQDSDFFTHALGHYCVVLYRAGALYVFNDYCGIYPVYCDPSLRTISTSFLALRKVQSSLTLSPQEFYEYVLTGATYADSTLFKEIRRLSSFDIHRLSPGHETFRKRINLPAFTTPQKLGDYADEVTERMRTYFSLLRQYEPNGIISALTGGLDSRMILAAAQNVGISATFFVNGGDDWSDVRIARQIAEGERLTFHHRNPFRESPVSDNEISTATRATYHFLDGLGYEGSLTDNLPDWELMPNYTGPYGLRLHGGAGEVFRNFWKLPDRKISVASFLRKTIGFRNAHYFHSNILGLSLDDFLESLHEKIKYMLGTSSDNLDPEDISLLYPLMRAKYFMGTATASDNLYSHALMPFAEPIFSMTAASIPMKFRNAYALQTAIIRRLDLKVASYPSDYGFDFSKSVPIKSRLLHFLQCHSKDLIPSSLLLLLHEFFSSSHSGGTRPYFLEASRVKTLLDLESLEVGRHIKLDDSLETGLFNRALTVELHLQDIF